MKPALQSGELGSNFAACSSIRSKRSDKRPSPVSIRFSAGEKESLEAAASGEALGPYIKRCVLRQHRIKRKRKASTRQHETIARTLRGLGASGVYGVLHTFILAVEEGRLRLEKDEEMDLRQAAFDIAAMRDDLMSALDLHVDAD